MFRLFNQPFLDDLISAGKSIHFTHDPSDDTGALGRELKYVKRNGYELSRRTLIATKAG